MEKPVYVVSWSEPYEGSTLVLATADYDTAVEKFEELADSRDYSMVLLDEWVGGEETRLDTKRSW